MRRAARRGRVRACSTGRVGGRGRARACGRGCCWRAARAHEARTAFDRGAAGHRRGAAAWRRGAGDRRLEMAALRARGRRRARRPAPADRRESPATWRTGSRLASGLGDRRAEADFTHPAGGPGGQPAAAAQPRWPAPRRAGPGPRVGVARGRAGASRSTASRPCSAYLGDADRLAEVVAELEPAAARAAGTPGCSSGRSSSRRSCRAAAGDWDAARARGRARRSESTGAAATAAYAGYFAGAPGLVRPAGRRPGRRAGARPPSAVDADLAGRPPVVVRRRRRPAGRDAARGRTVPTRPAGVARRGAGATGDPDTPEAWRLRCLAPLAAADRDAGDAGRGGGGARRRRVPARPGLGGGRRLLPARRPRRAPSRRPGRGRPGAWHRSRTRPAARWAPVRESVDGLLAQISSATS